jgi:uncharacterized membrane protein
MPASETAAISFGNWIIAFYIVYAVAAIAVVAALAVFISWTVNRFRGGSLTGEAKAGRRAGEAQTQA